MSSNIPYNQLGPSNSASGSLNSRLSYYPYDSDVIAANEQRMDAIREQDDDYDDDQPPIPPKSPPLPPGAAAPIPRFYGLAAGDGGPQPSISS